MQKLFLTFFYSGLSPRAPGTVGTLASLPFGLAILYYFGSTTLVLAIIFVCIVAIKEINKYESATGLHDHGSIVIDEAAGIWLTLVVAHTVSNIWFLAFASFVFFRFFDIYKPSIIGRIDRNVKGGLGVMGDDLMAGIFAGLMVQLSWNILLQLTLF